MMIGHDFHRFFIECQVNGTKKIAFIRLKMLQKEISKTGGFPLFLLTFLSHLEVTEELFL